MPPRGVLPIGNKAPARAPAPGDAGSGGYNFARVPAPSHGFFGHVGGAINTAANTVQHATHTVATPHPAPSGRVRYPVNRPTFDPRRGEPQINPTMGHLGQTFSPTQFRLAQALMANHLGTMFPGLTSMPLHAAVARVHAVLDRGGYLSGGKSFDQGIRDLSQTVNFEDKAVLQELQHAVHVAAHPTLMQREAGPDGQLRFAPTQPDSLGRAVPEGHSEQMGFARQMPLPLARPGRQTQLLPPISPPRNQRLA